MAWIIHGTPELDAQSSWRTVTGLCGLFAGLMLVVVGLRLYVFFRRQQSDRSFSTRQGIEVSVVVFGALLSLVYNIFVIIQTRYGLGLPKDRRPHQDLSMFLMYNYAARPLQWVAITCYKVAICMSCANFLRRADKKENERYRRVIYGSEILLVCLCIVGTACNIFNCSPIRKSLDPTLPGTCIDYALYNYAIWILNVVLDLVVFALPMVLFLKLSLERSQKIELIILFGLCLCATVLGVVKITQIKRIASGDGDSTIFCVLNALEANVGIIFSCNPYIRSLFKSSNRAPSQSHKTYNQAELTTFRHNSQLGGKRNARVTSISSPLRSQSQDHILERLDESPGRHDNGSGITHTVEWTVTRDGTPQGPMWSGHRGQPADAAAESLGTMRTMSSTDGDPSMDWKV